MATYYVNNLHGSASNSNAGTSASLPWLTLGKAGTTATAGDVVYVGGGGVYRETLTPSNAGSSGSIISFRADVKGQYTGYAGKVTITAHDDDTAAATRASCINLNGKNFVEYHDFTCLGGTSFVVGNTAFASATAYEGVLIDGCIIQNGTYVNALRVNLNACVTPTANGITVQRCKIYGGISFSWDSNASAHINSKIRFERNVVFAIAGGNPIDFNRANNNGSFVVGGLTVNNNFLFSCGSNCVYVNVIGNTTNPIYVVNNIFMNPSSYAVTTIGGAATSLVVQNNVLLGRTLMSSNVTELPPNVSGAPILLGGLHDGDIVEAYGYTPFMAFEPMSVTGITSSLIDRSFNSYLSSSDMYGNSNKMGRATPYAYAYHMDGSDAAVTDPNNVFTSDANAVDGLENTNAYTSTSGSTSSNYLMAEGTNAPSSGGTISKVQFRFLHFDLTGSNTGEVKIYTDGLGELLGTIAQTATASAAWTSWSDLTTPTGGWTWARVQALEFKAYRSSGSGNWGIYKIQVGVITDESTGDIGAVEANPKPIQNSTYYTEGAKSAEWNQGASFIESAFGLEASAHTISMDVRYDSNYTGTKPTLILLADSTLGISQTSDVMTVAANTWETLSIAVTPSAAGVVRVRLHNYDTSATGKVYFDNFLVE